MEIVLGILLLFGAFTLGVVTSDHTDHETRTARIESNGTDQSAQTVSASNLPTCRTSGSVRHIRDLTMPIARPVVQPPAPPEDAESVDWDE